jgi:hypothetical protein
LPKDEAKEKSAHGFWPRHYREIELAVEKELREVPGHPFDERHLATGMRDLELGKKAHEAHRPDRAHYAEIDRRVFHAQEVHRCRFGRLSLRHHLLEMRPDQASEISEMRQAVLASQQEPAELLLELVHGTRQRGLGDAAVLRRAREVQGLADRQEVADLVHFHAEPSSRIGSTLDNQRAPA